MKSNLIFSTLLTFSLLFVSCKKEEEATTNTSSKPKEIIMPRVQPIPAQNYTQQPVVQNNTPVQSQQPTTNNQAAKMNQTPVVTKPGMNPPHGQPGHRCDIAVGAPLNSPKAKPGTATTQQVTPTATTTQSTSTPAILNPNTPQTVTAPGMNPPHGQEGHQCGIAVGAPLPK
jgi:hypothetical protein